MKILQKVIFLPLLFMLSFSVQAEDSTTHYYSYKVKDQYLGRICLHSVGLDSTWNTALINAINEYSYDFPVWYYKFHFVHKISNGGPSCTYNVEVHMHNDSTFSDNGGVEYAAITTECHSWYKKPCDIIRINTAGTYKIYTSSARKGLLMHEMGHVIGLAHNGDNWRNTPIPNTNNDPDAEESIMKGGGGDNYTNDNLIYDIFTDYDVRSFQYLYSKW